MLLKASEWKMAGISGGRSISAVSGEISMALWQRYPLEQCIVDGLKSCNVVKAITSTSMMLNPGSMPMEVMRAIHAVGLFAGVSATLDLAGAGVSAFTYRMVL